MSLDTIIFGASAVIAVFGAVMMIGQRNPVASVLYFIVSLVAQAVLYVQLGALFLGAVLIIVYAGAILVLFLFVIMLLNLRGTEDFGGGSSPVSKFTKFLVAALLAVELGFVVRNGVFPDAGTQTILPDGFGSVKAVAELIFMKYLYPFELTSVLLLVAIVGAVVLAGRSRASESRDRVEDAGAAGNPPIEEVHG
ncbi:MAG: NADH-quinone oxidoreductase subunit J [candidate division Zixibacteria bacterium]|nr:NADH-quinone oxidoreductase subunit J [candidate division Zixibacteria bacterium]MDH3937431.1 NADH-quinone oxidoreductase subunit J [candidate division Zixibacteria bacterium]MDH4034969.1 NADH-quinone oxidoreductase subunit J [candidate division Zixibacteria bacterium]